MHIKLDKRCSACCSHLKFVGLEDGAYVFCRRYRLTDINLGLEQAVADLTPT